jgi:hypothetical protein
MSSGNPIDPSFQFATVTPSNIATLTYHGNQARCRAIYVGVTGNVAVADDQGTSVTFVGLVAGVVHPISTNKIFATGTTATSIIALF